jgi:hypothetical protein
LTYDFCCIRLRDVIADNSSPICVENGWFFLDEKLNGLKRTLFYCPFCGEDIWSEGDNVDFDLHESVIALIKEITSRSRMTEKLGHPKETIRLAEGQFEHVYDCVEMNVRLAFRESMDKIGSAFVSTIPTYLEEMTGNSEKPR